MLEQTGIEYIKVRTSNINILQDVNYYYKNLNGQFVLYKPSGILLAEMRLKEERHPELYMPISEREQAAVELQKIYNRKLKENLKTRNITEIRDNLVNIVTETLSEPRSGTMKQTAIAVSSLMSEFAEDKHLMYKLAKITYSDYTTALHSVNVMAFMIGFSFFVGYDWKKTQIFAIAALLHDIGKTKVPSEILNAPRKLSSEEFEIIQNHTVWGIELVSKMDNVSDKVLQAVYEHHEKLDGTGYPRKIHDISLVGQLVGIIDIYEALTNNDRPYRKAMEHSQAIELLKKDAANGKIMPELLNRFTESLHSNAINDSNKISSLLNYGIVKP